MSHFFLHSTPPGRTLRWGCGKSVAPQFRKDRTPVRKRSAKLLQPGRTDVTLRETFSIDLEMPKSARPGRSCTLIEPGASWRRGRDSNPRFRFPGTRAFQARPFNHSGTSPTIQVRDARGKGCLRRGSHRLAERAGFEPAIPESGIPVFETGAFNHSATSPSPKIVSKAKMSLFMSRGPPLRSNPALSAGSPG